LGQLIPDVIITTNIMDLDIILKIIGVITGVITAGKLIYDFAISRKNRLREDYKFAKDFFNEINKTENSHPFVIERGYQAISGDTSLTIQEAEYLFSLKNPSSALRDYVLARHYLEHLQESGDLKINFRKKYLTNWSRKWRKIFYLISYLVTAFLALAPTFFIKSIKGDTSSKLLVLFIFAVAFAPLAVASIKEFGKIYRGEQLVDRQEKHSQPIDIKDNRI